jgi:hypothetical protein
MTSGIAALVVYVVVLVYVIYRATARVRRYRAGRVSPAATMYGGTLSRCRLDRLERNTDIDRIGR